MLKEFELKKTDLSTMTEKSNKLIMLLPESFHEKTSLYVNQLHGDFQVKLF